jgi:hypothetical protein
MAMNNINVISFNIPDNVSVPQHEKNIITGRETGNNATCQLNSRDHLVFPGKKINVMKLKPLLIMQRQCLRKQGFSSAPAQAFNNMKYFQVCKISNVKKYADF